MLPVFNFHFLFVGNTSELDFNVSLLRVCFMPLDVYCLCRDARSILDCVQENVFTVL